MDGGEDFCDEQDVVWDEDGHSTRAFEAWTTSRDDVLVFFDLTYGWSIVEYEGFRHAAYVSAAETYGDVPAEFDRLAKVPSVRDRLTQRGAVYGTVPLYTQTTDCGAITLYGGGQ